MIVMKHLNYKSILPTDYSTILLCYNNNFDVNFVTETESEYSYSV